MGLTSIFPKIKIANVGGKKTYIPLEHNVYATQRVGRVVPYMTRFCDAKEKHKIDLETLNYMAPMISPTVGDIRLKHWLYFVPLEKMSKTLGNMFARQTAVKYDGTEFNVTQVPHLKLCYLTMLCMIGSFCTIYVKDKNNNSTAIPFEDGNSWLFPSNYYGFVGNTNGLSVIESLWNSKTNGDFLNSGTVTSGNEGKTVLAKYSSRLLGGMTAWCINAKYLLPSNDIVTETGTNSMIQIPLANPATNSFIDWRDSSGKPMYDGKHLDSTHGVDCTPVSLESPDYAVTRSFKLTASNGDVHDVSITFAFRFSDFGRALRDVIIASGNQLDISSTKDMSFLPFLATYMAYFHAQPLQRYKNFQNTACYKILRRFETTNIVNLDADMINLHNTTTDAKLFVEFINDLASMWAVEPQDFVGAHTREPITSPLILNSLDGFINSVADGVSTQSSPVSVPINQNGDSRSEPSIVDSNNAPYIDNVNHDVFTSSLLQRITQRLCCNSIVGRPLRKLLKINGYGDWMDESPDLVDYGELRLNLKPVVSTSDTMSDKYDSSSGAVLGQLGGRGYGHSYHKAKPYENKQAGYMVLLTSVYVDSGFCQSIDPNNYCVNVDDFYKREFDGMGFEIDEKNQVHGSLTWVEEGDTNKLNEPFGYIARSTKFKHISNKLLGDFTDGEMKDVYSPYHLEKLLPIGKRSINSQVTNTVAGYDFTKVELGSRFAPADLPIAGNIWRYLGRLPWLGQFDRIFKLYDYDVRKIQGVFGLESDNFFETVSAIYAYFVSTPENYTFLNTIHYDSWQDKKPISESFGTLSEIFDGYANNAETKA